ncbi:MAG: MBL fold metallo-hydrolase [Candidatus Azobacteroides sp.]|nr:MBL fold metallo-hydrolase [Candidatus Azobacteroides sp.]
MWVFFSVILLLTIFIVSFLNQPSFGRLPSGERLERIKNSPNYRDGKFQNVHETPQITSDKSFFQEIIGFLFNNVERLRPETALPVVKTDLHRLHRKEDILVWLGHGSYFLQTDGIRVLVDPVFYAASPVSFYNKAFKGTNLWKPEDIPDIDFLFISHDHWDHLDYKTVKELKSKVGKVICPLGVGEHFEYWGYNKNQVIEMDWYDEATFDNGFTVFCLPARHFSGRGLKPNQSLWASFMLETPSQRIFIGGDGGYDTHFAEIGKRFYPIDLAILENGQYDTSWKYIHLLPEDLVKAIKDLNPEKVLTVHNSKYALGKHAWDEPLEKIADAAQKESLPLLTPKIGEIVNLKDSTQMFEKWWRNEG